ncbi:MAG: hypothetical protein K0S67_958 [Nitrososphaeraceae archaeon]|nr:hypothetical protein [Nitrososphaeraceae archaeon]
MRSLDRAKAKAIVGIAHNQGLPFQVVQLDVEIDVVVDNAEYETLGSN